VEKTGLNVGGHFAFAAARDDQDRTDVCFGFGSVKNRIGRLAN
jgi:hypothetical protein